MTAAYEPRSIKENVAGVLGRVRPVIALASSFRRLNTCRAPEREPPAWSCHGNPPIIDGVGDLGRAPPLVAFLRGTVANANHAVDTASER
jgi:hypothetical protein